MSDANEVTTMALQYVREELAGIRASVSTSSEGMRSELATLAGELRGFIQEYGPAFAVIQHRLSEAEKDLTLLGGKLDQAEKDREMEANQARRDRIAQRWTLAVAVAVTILAWVLPLLVK